MLSRELGVLIREINKQESELIRRVIRGKGVIARLLLYREEGLIERLASIILESWVY